MGNVVPSQHSDLVVAQSVGDWAETWRVLTSSPSAEKSCKEEDVPMNKVLNYQMGAQWWVGTLPWPICSTLPVTLKGIMQSRKNNPGRKITVILSIIFCGRRKSDLLRGRGSSLSRDAQAPLTPGATSSSSRGSPRCSQASWETRALQRLLVLPWGLLPVNASLGRHPEQVPKPTQLARPNTQVASNNPAQGPHF